MIAHPLGKSAEKCIKIIDIDVENFVPFSEKQFNVSAFMQCWFCWRGRWLEINTVRPVMSGEIVVDPTYQRKCQYVRGDGYKVGPGPHIRAAGTHCTQERTGSARRMQAARICHDRHSDGYSNAAGKPW
ncbi:hypothetical protein GCM10011411_14480 [Aurantiacibacter arachoides]|nr:hypothetical protein GCM10011411_14480 [Aurantiacibacter arachoides]